MTGGVRLFWVNIDYPFKRAIIHKETCGHARSRVKLERDGYWAGPYQTVAEAEARGYSEQLSEVRFHKICFRS